MVVLFVVFLQFLKPEQVNLSSGQGGRLRGEQACRHEGWDKGARMKRGVGIGIYTTMRKIDSEWLLLGKGAPVRCSVVTWKGELGGSGKRGPKGGRYMYTES